MSTANVTMRLDTNLIERIDRAARHAGMSRTEYVVSWLPENYDSKAKEQPEQQNAGQR